MRLAASTAALALAFALTACGEKSEPEVVAPKTTSTQAATTGTQGSGGGQNQGGGQAVKPEDQVEDAVIAVLGGGDPAEVCGELATQKYVKTAYGDEKGCRAAVAKQGSFSVKVSAVEVQGRKATAKAKPSAGPNKGETINVKLVEEKGAWKVDSAVSNAPAGP